MESFFSDIGISAWDFVQVSATSLLTMLVFFGVKDRRHLWPGYFLLVVFALQCVFIAAFHEGLRVKLFAGLMLMSALFVAATRGGRWAAHSSPR